MTIDLTRRGFRCLAGAWAAATTLAAMSFGAAQASEQAYVRGTVVGCAVAQIGGMRRVA